MSSTQIDIVIPVYLNPQDFVDAIIMHTSSLESSPSLRILAVQCVEDDVFDSRYTMPTDSDGNAIPIIYDKANMQKILRKHEILEVPCLVIGQGAGLQPLIISLTDSGDPSMSASVHISSMAASPSLDTARKVKLAQSQSLPQPQPQPQQQSPAAQFQAALRAFDAFSLAEACRLFHGVIEAGDAHSSHVDGALFNMASLMQMVDYPTLAVRYMARHIARCAPPREAAPGEEKEEGGGEGEGAPAQPDMVANTFLWNVTQGAVEDVRSGNGEDGAHLLECCVRCYRWLCELNASDVTSQHRLNTLGRPFVPAGSGGADKGQAAKNLNAYARRIYEDMGEKFEGRLLDQLGYRGPWVLRDMVARVQALAAPAGPGPGPGPGCWRVLDVGSGSGLVGRVFSSFVRRSEAGAGTHPALSPAAFSSVYEDTAPLRSANEHMTSVTTATTAAGTGAGAASDNEGVLVGVDISSKMCEITAASGHYDYVACCDAVEAVRALTAHPPLLDMVVSADTFIYMGALGPFFGACRAALRPGGLLTFSVEDLTQSTMRLDRIAPTGAAEPDDHSTAISTTHLQLVDDDVPGAVPGWGGALLTSSRYAHSPRYIAALARLHGFRICAEEDVVLRTECTAQIKGRMYVLASGLVD